MGDSILPEDAPLYVVCPDCGMKVHRQSLRVLHARGAHHEALALTTRRVRDGWLPCIGLLLEVAEELGAEVESEGCWSDLGTYRRVHRRELWWIRDDQAEDVARFGRAPSALVPELERLRAAATYCRAGLPWWQARLVVEALPELREHVLSTARPEPVGMIRGRPW